MQAKRLAVALFIVACSIPASVISPKAMTLTAIGETFYRVHLYGELHGRIPDSMSVLPERETRANRTTDGWGQPLSYSVGSDEPITIASLGKDGQAGGLGADQDVAVSYQSRRPDGSMWIGEELWIVEAEVR